MMRVELKPGEFCCIGGVFVPYIRGLDRMVVGNAKVIFKAPRKGLKQELLVRPNSPYVAKTPIWKTPRGAPPDMLGLWPKSDPRLQEHDHDPGREREGHDGARPRGRAEA